MSMGCSSVDCIRTEHGVCIVGEQSSCNIAPSLSIARLIALIARPQSLLLPFVARAVQCSLPQLRTDDLIAAKDSRGGIAAAAAAAGSTAPSWSVAAFCRRGAHSCTCTCTSARPCRADVDMAHVPYAIARQAPSRRAAALMRKKQDKNALEVDLPQQNAAGKRGKKAFAKVRAVGPVQAGRRRVRQWKGRAADRGRPTMNGCTRPRHARPTGRKASRRSRVSVAWSLEAG